MNDRIPPRNNEEEKIETEEYGPLPGLDYRFFEYMQEGVVVYTPVSYGSKKIVDLTIIFANLAAYRQRSSLKKELVGKNITEIYGYEESQEELNIANEIISSGRGTKYETYFAPLDKYLSITAFAPKEDLYVTFTTDITKQKNAEKELLALNQELLGIIEFLPDATFVIDENRRVIAWNKALEQMTGVSKEEMMGKGDYAYSVPFYGHKRPIIIDLIFFDEEEIETKYSYVKREENTLFAEVFVNNLYGGKGAYVFVKASPLYDKDGNLYGSIETVRDITVQKKAEMELLESEEKFRSTIEQSTDGISIMDENGVIIEWNKGMEKITGHQKEEELGKLIWESQYELLPEEEKTPELYDYIKGTILQFLQIGEANWIKKPLDRRIKRPNGEIRYTQSITYPIKTEKGTIIGSITRDVTEQKKIEEELRYEQDLLNSVLNNIPVSVAVAEAPSGRLIRANEQFEKIWEQPFISSKDIEEYSNYKGFYQDGSPYKPEEWPLARSITAGEIVTDEEISVLFEDGTRKVLSVSSTPIKDETGQINFGVVIAADITLRKNAEEALKESEATFRAFFELAAVGTAMIDPSSRLFTEVNDQFSKITGYTPEELHTKTFSDLTHPDDREWDSANFKRFLKGKMPQYDVEKRYIRKDGQAIWVHVTVTLIKDSQGKPIRTVGIILDITNRKKAEQLLMESEEKFSKAFYSNSAGMAITNIEGKIIEVNNAYANITGYKREELLGNTVLDLNIITLEERDNVLKVLTEGKSIYNLEREIQTKGGEKRNVMYTVVFIEYGGEKKVFSIIYDITNIKKS